MALVEVMQDLLGIGVWEEVIDAPVERLEKGRYRLQLRMAPHVTALMAQAFADKIQLRLDGANASKVVFLGYQDLHAVGPHRLLLEVLLPEKTA